MKEILSPEEINALLAHVDEEEKAGSALPGQGRFIPQGSSVRPYDFLRQRCLTQSESQVLIDRHNVAMQEFSRVLLRTVQTRTRWKIHELQFVNRADFKSMIDSSSIIGLWGLFPRAPRGVIEWEGTWGYHLLEKFLGGARNLAREASSLTELEAILFRKIIALFLGVLKRTWNLRDKASFEAGIIVKDVSTLEAEAGFETAVSVTLEVIYDDAKIGYMRLFYPSHSLRRLVCLKEYESRKTPDLNLKNEFFNKMHGVNLPLSVEVARTKLGLREFMRLNPGDTLMFRERLQSSHTVKVNGVPKFTALFLDTKHRGRLRIKSEL